MHLLLKEVGVSVNRRESGGKKLVNPDYSGKATSYFTHIRQEISPLLPLGCERILEVGCGTGATLRWLKSHYPEAETVGIEFEASNRFALEEHTDHFHIGDAETFDKDIGTFDLILCLDVLEHLRSPEDALKRYVRLLRPNGIVIISVPAVSYIGVSLPLLLGRHFTYTDSGILDRTHTRLFVEETVVNLANDAGLSVDAGLLGGIRGPKSRTLNAVTLGLFRHYLTKQYIIRASHAVGARVSRVDWRIAEYPLQHGTG